MSSDNDQFLRTTGAFAGGGTGGFWGGLIGAGLGFIIAGPPGAGLGMALCGYGGAAKGSELGRRNPKTAIAAASITAIATGGAASPAIAAGAALSGMVDGDSGGN